MTDDLSLIINGAVISGWETIRVTRGIERFPSDFSVEMTERYPGEAQSYFDVMQSGDAVTVKLGADTVLTGYVDRFIPTYTPNQHSITVTGRSKCADLVDCSAEYPNGQIVNATVKEIATKLAAPYGIKVKQLTPELVVHDYAGKGSTTIIPQININFIETPYEIIEEICRYMTLLAYDSVDGDLILSQAGSGKMSSGFKEGVNVQRATMSFAMDQRFSDYQVILNSFWQFGDLGDSGNLVTTSKDPSVIRHRLKNILSNASAAGIEIGKQRGDWESARRYGRSEVLTLKCDSWRDAAGTLWETNTLAPVDLPGMKLHNKMLLISEVTYFRDNLGTSADLVLMPPSAFTPKPDFIPVPLDLLPVKPS
ncbi:prophage tail protein [Sulfuriferula multivorans]|uniref:Prophage tail protein n=1 Tax=Sulfuriferula multivorans TaxID=1559896 RepID=A0A401J9S2_9PROT|nr:hypothetical protein [Sulfuriferula multivorans]GBL44425.1 prophage tail protein [Sulfuriferula multivorans]